MAEKQVRSTRPSPKVYRRRRLAALIAGLLVIVLLVWAGIAIASSLRPKAADGNPAQAAAPSNTPTAPESSAPAPEPSAGPAVCAEGDVSVLATTAQATHGPSQNPVLVMTIKNIGKSECVVNVGTSQQEFTVMSGTDRIFSTADCLADPSDIDITMKPGGSESARFTWERVRSAPGCKIVNAKPRPGWYGFTAKLGNITSEKAGFELK
ncbi:hypothetical protein ACFY5D_12290 [Paeniglutamicibacter sp. NPDC012692]|uniref:hypothetical protein n=1 Tax=Paeniglutamicibacter sp. NPDC012692 TaxID=3364388 RepID=UPI0036A9D64A